MSADVKTFVTLTMLIVLWIVMYRFIVPCAFIVFLFQARPSLFLSPLPTELLLRLHF
jgi:hypothetical protein